MSFSNLKCTVVLVIILIISLVSCNEGDDNTNYNNRVLVLKVDYLTSAFEGGTELLFEEMSSEFTINVDYYPPGDFGSIKLEYEEINKTLFDGTIIWMGLGKRIIPKKLDLAPSFKHVLTDDYIIPDAGFEDVFNPNNTNYDYSKIWNPVQSLQVVRDYLKNNIDTPVKLFLYTPSVGIGNPADWDWYIFLKKNEK